MKYLKIVLILFFFIDICIFLAYQINPQILAGIFPQFNITDTDTIYPRLVGILALTFGIMRLYGALNIREKRAVVVSLWSWIIELLFIVTEILRGAFKISDNLLGLTVAILMLLWTLLYMKSIFRES